MRLAIMQPYFLPYIGYWQLMNAVDVFVVYDNIKYTKKGWINRNRMLLNGADRMFSLPLKNDSDFLDVVDRELAEGFSADKLFNQFRGAYSRAPHFKEVSPLLERILHFEDRNLFRYIYHSIVCLCQHLGLDTKIIVSSQVTIDHSLKAQDKVQALCQALGAQTYINPVGGLDLYSKEDFQARGVDLRFIQSKLIPYDQFGGGFMPWLSIIDVLMFNDPPAVTSLLNAGYTLA
jgi:hypothetical protein